MQSSQQRVVTCEMLLPNVFEMSEFTKRSSNLKTSGVFYLEAHHEVPQAALSSASYSVPSGLRATATFATLDSKHKVTLVDAILIANGVFKWKVDQTSGSAVYLHQWYDFDKVHTVRKHLVQNREEREPKCEKSKTKSALPSSHANKVQALQTIVIDLDVESSV